MDIFYWSFVTATTVGYGDLRPVKNASKISAVLIAFLGLMVGHHGCGYRSCCESSLGHASLALNRTLGAINC
jgi:hypothetical protein